MGVIRRSQRWKRSDSNGVAAACGVSTARPAWLPAKRTTEPAPVTGARENYGHHTTFAHPTYARGQSLSIHGCIYGIKDGRWKNLNVTVSGLEQLPAHYRLRPLGLS